MIIDNIYKNKRYINGMNLEKVLIISILFITFFDFFKTFITKKRKLFKIYLLNK